jgi:hypothetical protein
MLAPDEKRSLDEIVRELMDKQDQQELNKEAFELDLRSTIDTAKVLFSTAGLSPQPLWGFRQDNIDGIEAVHRQIEKLQRGLQALPDRARFLLFAPSQITGRLSRMPSQAEQQQTLKNVGLVVSMLARLRTRCDQLLADPPGDHGLTRFREKWIAEETKALLERHGQRVTNSSSSTSHFRQSTSLVWEAVTEEYGKDLQKACQNAFVTEKSKKK